MLSEVKNLNPDTDLSALLQIEQSCFSTPLSELQLLKQLESPRIVALGLFAPELVGFAIYSVVLDEAELLQIGVFPTERGRGYAGLLMQAGMGALRERGIVRLMLEVRASNIAACTLYERCGFIVDGRRNGYYPAEAEGQEREDALLMSVTL